jgi:hypothetical protein
MESHNFTIAATLERSFWGTGVGVMSLFFLLRADFFSWHKIELP